MKIAIFGAGAIGGYMGAKLAASGVDVTLIARGPHLEAMQRDGLRLIEFDGTETVTHPRLVADSGEGGPHDYVILAVKAHSVSPALDAITPLIGPDTAVVTAQNGVPWSSSEPASSMIATLTPAPMPTAPGLRASGGSGFVAIWWEASVMP